MRRTTKVFKFSLAIAGIALLTGCAGTRTVDQQAAANHLANSDYKLYASQFLNEKSEPKYDPESLLDALEAGKAFNDAGMWRLSRDAFDAASKLLLWKEDTVDTPAEVANLMGTTLTNDALGSYQGKIHQGSLIDYYQAINNLMLGQEGDARVDFNRLQVRQSNAVTQLNAFASATNKQVGESWKEDQSSSAKKTLGEVGPKVADGIKDLPGGLNRSKMRIAAGDVMSAVFRATSSAQSDKSSNVARDMLKSAGQASATRGGNAMISYLSKEIRSGKGALKNKVVVVYEDGMGPSLKEFRIDLPLFVVTDKVTYTGLALPQFQRGQPAFGSLSLGEGKTKAETSTLTDINELAGLEFDAAYKGIVAKAVISTIIKTTAQAAINHQVDKEIGGGLAGLVLKAGVGAAQYALTKADTRAWVNLPNTIQMAVVDRPKNGKLSISTSAGAPIGEVEVAENTNTLVLVKAAGTSGKPSVFKQELPAQTIVAGL